MVELMSSQCSTLQDHKNLLIKIQGISLHYYVQHICIIKTSRHARRKVISIPERQQSKGPTMIEIKEVTVNEAMRQRW